MEKIDYLINYLLNEDEEYQDITIPSAKLEKEKLLRSLMNVRPPKPISEEFLSVQDAYLHERLLERGVTSINDIKEIEPNIYLWQGDITTLEVDAIVNAANSEMLGCFAPLHACIDNAIHTYAGVQLRLECAALMDKQGHEEEIGKAKMTKAYNLPSKYVLHTVGPFIYGYVTDEDSVLLASCYRACLDLALAHNLESVAFCCISTGEFHFPNEAAAKIAIKTVKDWLNKHPHGLKIIFNVFKDTDYEIYQQLLG